MLEIKDQSKLRASIALASILWAVPITGAAHLAATSVSGQSPRPLSDSRGLPIQRSAVPLPVQFRTIRERGLLVKAWLNDTGPYVFAIDTGAGMSIISAAAATRAGLSVRQARRTEIGGLSSAIIVSDREAVINRLALGGPYNFLTSSTLALIAPYLPSGIDGILDPTEAYWPLGYRIDMPNQQLLAFDPAMNPLSLTNQPLNGAVVRWVRDRDSGRPFVRLTDGRLALIDTGSGFGLAVTQLNGSSGSDHGTRDKSARDLGGGTIQSRRIGPTTVGIGPLVLRGIPTDVLSGVHEDAPVILGRDALYPFRISFDPVHRLVEIAPMTKER